MFSGKGVATEWCHKFEAETKEASLVKRDQGQISELKAARGVGLEAEHTLDYYIWYTGGNWHGFSGNAQPNVNAPYIVCSEHTREKWEEKLREEEEAKKEEEEQATTPAQP